MRSWNLIRITAGIGRMASVGVVCLLAMTSCEDGVTDPTDLRGEWRLEELREPDGTSVAPPDSGRFTVQFEADGQVGVRADCNGCGGRYTLVDHDSLTVSQLACTLIACPNAPFDARYLHLLVGESTFELDEDGLTIRSSRGSLRFAR